ncbi:MAG TPA: hypothetical protein VGV85_08270 [Longimicrobiaceae bacterium]|nr:hypothetical protein [Longimicrobiaceae bacterium]
MTTRHASALAALLLQAGWHAAPRGIAAPGQARRPCTFNPNSVSTGASDARHAMGDSARVVRFRSPSRAGRGDLGVNRAPMARFSGWLRAAGSSAARP